MTVPATVRYAQAAQDETELRQGSCERNSPRTALITKSASPPAISCMPENDSGETGSGSNLETIVPIAQDAEAPRRIRMSLALASPDSSCLQAIRPTPANPGTKNSNLLAGGRSPAGTTALRIAIQKGIVANRTAARPDGTRC